MKFQESKLAHKYLDGLKGIEIGGSAHNPFGLDTINVDIYPGDDTEYKRQEQELCGEKLKVDAVAPAWKLPFDDNSFDFVLNSHVIEHCWDVIGTIKEWVRVARKYIFFVVPHVDRTFDKGRPLTGYDELLKRHLVRNEEKEKEDRHHSVWNTDSFVAMLYRGISDGLFDGEIVDVMDVDDKVGNGFMVVFRVNS